MVVYYDSKTGNVKRFADKLSTEFGLNCININDLINPIFQGVLITYTTGNGKVPIATEIFMEKYHHLITAVSSSGNANWGNNFGICANIISNKYNIPILSKFELSGIREDLLYFIDQYEDLIKNKNVLKV